MQHLSLAGLRVAVYARYSTDKQNPRSIDDQVRTCRERVEALGGTIDAELVFSDAAISGASLARPGLAALVQATRGRRVDVVVTEALDRIGRDTIQTLTLMRQFRTAGARLLALDGFDTGGDKRTAKVMGTMRALMGELYLDDLSDKTQRGLRGNHEEGLVTGGRTFGYRNERNPAGKPIRVIDEREAEVVRDVFDRYAGGASIRELAARLNAAGVLSPRGGMWGHITIRAMLRNPLYVGRVVFGRQKWTKDPETLKRTKHSQPKSQWATREQPELRIVDEKTWALVQAHASHVARVHKSGARPKRGRALSGLFACGACGAGMIVTSGGRYYTCGGRHKGHPCTNARSLSEEAVRTWLFQQIADALGSPRIVAEVRARFAKRQGASNGALRDELTKRRDALSRSEGKVRKLIELLVDADTPLRRQALADEELSAETQAAAIVALERRLGSTGVLPSTEQVMAFLRRLPVRATQKPDETRRILDRLLAGPAVCTPPAKAGGPYHVRVRLRPSEVLEHTATALTGAVFSRVSCGGGDFTLEYSAAEPELELEGLVENPDGRAHRRPRQR